MVTPIKKGTKTCSRKTSTKPPTSSSTSDASAVQSVSSYLTLKQVSLTIALTLGGSWNTTLTEFLTNNKQQKGNNKTCSNKSSLTSPSGCMNCPALCSIMTNLKIGGVMRNGTNGGLIMMIHSISQKSSADKS